MFHVKQVYVKTSYSIPGLASPVHIAELSPIEGTNMCKMKRLIEMMDGNSISGIWSSEGLSKGIMTVPNKHVPHPDSYRSYSDIDFKLITHLEFEALWIEAAQKL